MATKIRPMLFNTDMVRAILDGKKAATRRAVKYTARKIYDMACVNGLWHETHDPQNPPEQLVEWYVKNIAKSPYQPGDILYVRETFCEEASKYYFRADFESNYLDACETLSGGYPSSCRYRDCDMCMAGPQRIYWHPSIHMPREAARIFLRVTGVRVERLQEPFFEQGSTIFALRKEGMDIGDQCRQCIDNYGWPCCNDLDPDLEVDEETGADTEGGSECGVLDRIRDDFARLWDSTIKPADRAVYGWDANPYVWAISFERISKNEAMQQMS